MMTVRNPDKSLIGVLFLFFVLIFSAFLSEGRVWFETREGKIDSPIFVEIKGDVRYPAVYGFKIPPVLKRLVRRAGGLTRDGCKGSLPAYGVRLSTGRSLFLASKNGGCDCDVEEMPPYYRVTLGIPLSLNREKAEHLTAVPGIGPKTAQSIVRERDKRGGFRKMADILLVPGIGPAVYEKIRPYLSL